MSKVPTADHPSRHPSSHHSDHSGAHVRGTHHHEAHAHDPHDGLMPGEGGQGVEHGDHDTSHGEPPAKHADKHLSEHPTKMDLPAAEEGREE